ncbi:hypothetical protein XENOCAPTIV_026234 [Xenoophorus captivus]|uniref:Uncharacterized protein n=1 Tax=Xenoophorus captivus TaxID=1517983 RepID=A0ABV0QNX9_9TELE
MQSWMSATQEFFCRESMVSRMYSPPFSTCESSPTNQSHIRSIHWIMSQFRLFFGNLFSSLKSSVSCCVFPFKHFNQLSWSKACADRTFRTNVLSLSGISSGMVVLTSTIAERGMLTFAHPFLRASHLSSTPSSPKQPIPHSHQLRSKDSGRFTHTQLHSPLAYIRPRTTKWKSHAGQ